MELEFMEVMVVAVWYEVHTILNQDAYIAPIGSAELLSVAMCRWQWKWVLGVVLVAVVRMVMVHV